MIATCHTVNLINGGINKFENKVNSMNDFEDLWNLKPKDKSRVWVYNKETGEHEEKQIFRSFRSYLNIPPKDKSIPKSWMHDELELEVPEILQKYVEDAQKEDSRYNSMTVNWYEKDDFIEPHRDCDNYMVDDYKIKIISLHEPNTNPRAFKLKNVATEEVEEICFAGGVPIYLSKKNNSIYRHSVGPGEGRRISITFRMLDVRKYNDTGSN